MDDVQMTDDITFETLQELDEVPLGPGTHALVHSPFAWNDVSGS
jgi:hypothetical protein